MSEREACAAPTYVRRLDEALVATRAYEFAPIKSICRSTLNRSNGECAIGHGAGGGQHHSRPPKPLPVSLADLFTKKPQATNDTMRQIEESNRRLDEQNRHLDEARARADEREAAFREREQAALSAAEEAREKEAAANRREEAALAEVAQAKIALHQGIRPVVMPTTAQVQAAMERIRYDPEKYHLAVCGTSGSGKSSLINAFRGLRPSEGGAAAIGVTETTSAVTRYPHPRNEVPYSRLVWYDIPGAGTTAVSDWQYFNDQGLFVFDFIMMVYDVRFTKIDVGILENCYRFDIPVFVVRSKADQHIDNMMKLEEVDWRSEKYEKLYQEMKRKFVDATRSDFYEHMEAMTKSPVVGLHDRRMMWNQRVYIVSSANVRNLLQSSVKNVGGLDQGKSIDEVLLVEDMLRAAAMRRYSKPEEKGIFKKGRESV